MSWRPEMTVDADTAAALITEQFPQFTRVEALGEGWDYTAFRVDGSFVFRFPRRAVILPGMAREIAIVPRLKLPVQVPVPLFIGVPAKAFPWPFYGARYIEGEEPLAVSDEVRARASMDLARALRALHAHDPSDLSIDANQRANMERRVPWARSALAQLGLQAEHVLRPAEALVELPASALCHGDLHFRQVLVGETLNGIIDWVDLCRANPGIDLSLLWSFVPRDLFDAFLAEYGPIEEEALLVARVLAIGLNATLVTYARDVGNKAVEAAARAELLQALAD